MLMRIITAAGFGMALACAATGAQAQDTDCDKACLEDLAGQYQKAYAAHDASMLPISDHVRYTENNVEMPFPDGTWDTVTKVVGPTQVISDPMTGNVGMYTAIMQDDIEGYLAIRFKVEDGKITEIEHIISTKRNLSSPPTPIAPVKDYKFEPIIDKVVPKDERVSRDRLAFHANGYFNTLQHNDGEIRDTCFHDDATRRENGMLFKDIKGGFESGRYLFNNRVRREVVVIDEERQIAMARGFIDHKGVLNDYKLTDGTPAHSIFQEPQTWAFLEMFKVTDNCIAAVVANFYQSSYYQNSPWTKTPDR
jgi:hypothetical protein